MGPRRRFLTPDHGLDKILAQLGIDGARLRRRHPLWRLCVGISRVLRRHYAATANPRKSAGRFKGRVDGPAPEFLPGKGVFMPLCFLASTLGTDHAGILTCLTNLGSDSFALAL